jgi:hypothetical protein
VKTLAFIFWLAFAFAIYSGMHGNDTAINGIIGAGIGALIFTGLAVSEWRSR